MLWLSLRMNQLTADLVDHVPHRQWVLTFPLPIRKPKLRGAVLR